MRVGDTGFAVTRIYTCRIVTVVAQWCRAAHVVVEHQFRFRANISSRWLASSHMRKFDSTLLDGNISDHSSSFSLFSPDIRIHRVRCFSAVSLVA